MINSFTYGLLSWQALLYPAIVFVLLFSFHAIEYKQVSLRVFPLFLEVSGGCWPISLYNRMKIGRAEIEEVHAVLMLNFGLLDDVDTHGIFIPGASGSGEWTGWDAMVVPTDNRFTSALAVKTNGMKLLIGCPDPVTAAEKIRSIYGIPGEGTVVPS